MRFVNIADHWTSSTLSMRTEESMKKRRGNYRREQLAGVVIAIIGGDAILLIRPIGTAGP